MDVANIKSFDDFDEYLKSIGSRDLSNSEYKELNDKLNSLLKTGVSSIKGLELCQNRKGILVELLRAGAKARKCQLLSRKKRKNDRRLSFKRTNNC